MELIYLLAVSLIIILLLVAIDQLLKIIMSIWLSKIGEYIVWDGVFSLSYVTNKGAAWGMFNGQRFVLIGVTLAAIILIAVLIYKGKIKGVCYSTAAVMILAGGIGNLIDRIFRAEVIDYLRVLFIDFPVFNFADCLITVGAIFLAVKLVQEICLDYKQEKTKSVSCKSTGIEKEHDFTKEAEKIKSPED